MCAESKKKMTKTEKLEVLQGVANDVVNRNTELESREYGIDDVAQAIKSMEIILVAIGARHEPVFVDAMNPEGSKPPPEQS